MNTGEHQKIKKVYNMENRFVMAIAKKAWRKKVLD
jgi:hypothetical protein